MKLILNPKYEALRPYLLRLKEHFEKEGREIHAGRNVIRVLTVGGLELCVKRYAVPSLKRRVQQMLYKQRKAKRAYISPMLLRERGFESPESVAYVRDRKGLLSETTYFVCLHSSYRYSMEDVHLLPPGEAEELTRCFARFAARLHKNGFLHRDFSSSDILYDKIDGKYHFSLIDTNSLRVRKVDVARGLRNLRRLSGDERFFEILEGEYLKERGLE